MDESKKSKLEDGGWTVSYDPDELLGTIQPYLDRERLKTLKEVILIAEKYEDTWDPCGYILDDLNKLIDRIPPSGGGPPGQARPE